jgi:hypothetical protein
MFVKTFIWTQLMINKKVTKDERIIADLYNAVGCPVVAM